MKRVLLMTLLCVGMIACFAQKATKGRRPQQQRLQRNALNESQRKLFYCSCAYTNYGLPVGEIKYSYYELIADKGKKPVVVYCEDRDEGEPEKKRYPITEKDVTTLYNTLQDLKVDSLDGYQVSEDMNGGTSYRIHVEYADGRKVTASWFTHYPKGAAVAAYNTILRFLSSKAKK